MKRSKNNGNQAVIPNIWIVKPTSILAVLALVCFLGLKQLYAQSNPHNTRILTIGNSFARNACEYLEQITESVEGHSIEIIRANIGGCSLEKHAKLIDSCAQNPNFKPYQNKYTLKELLEMYDYDFVTIQQVSSLSFKPKSFQPYADQLVEFIHNHVPGAQVIIHQTWAYHPDSERLKNWAMSREAMHEGLVKNYNVLADRYDTFILPSGNAFYSSFKKREEMILWTKDHYHANAQGCYLAGCTWFGVLFDESPKAVSFIPEGISTRDAKFIRKTACKESKKVLKKIRRVP